MGYLRDPGARHRSHPPLTPGMFRSPPLRQRPILPTPGLFGWYRTVIMPPLCVCFHRCAFGVWLRPRSAPCSPPSGVSGLVPRQRAYRFFGRGRAQRAIQCRWHLEAAHAERPGRAPRGHVDGTRTKPGMSGPGPELDLGATAVSREVVASQSRLDLSPSASGTFEFTSLP